MRLIAALSLLSWGVHADYLLNQRFPDDNCTGAVSAISVAFDGCVPQPGGATSQSVTCTAGGGYTITTYSDLVCAGVPVQTQTLPATPCAGTGQSLSCEPSSAPYPLPTSSAFVQTFYSWLSSCPVPGGAVATRSVIYPTDACLNFAPALLASGGAPAPSIFVTCNATGGVSAFPFSARDCAQPNPSIQITTGCEAETQGSSTEVIVTTCSGGGGATQSPTPAATPTPTITAAGASVTGSESSTPTPTASPGAPASNTGSGSPSPTDSGTATVTPSGTPTASAAATPAASSGASFSATTSGSVSPSTTPTASSAATPAASPGASSSTASSGSVSPSTTRTGSDSGTPTPSLSRGASASNTASPTATLSRGASPSVTQSLLGGAAAARLEPLAPGAVAAIAIFVILIFVVAPLACFFCGAAACCVALRGSRAPRPAKLMVPSERTIVVQMSPLHPVMGGAGLAMHNPVMGYPHNGASV